MGESCREQHPLLYEDLSEEEKFSPRYQRRFRPMVFRGRVRNKVKGAAAIIRLWPEHWSSSVTFWWMGIVMIVLTTFIVYSIATSVALLPPLPYREMHMRTLNDAITPVNDNTQLPFNVYMHIFAENNQNIDLNSFLPYIDIIANKYPDFKYHLIIVLDDTISSDPNIFSAEENNENALNSLWGRNSVHGLLTNHVSIEHVTLSKYMDKSPLREHWKQLPKQLIEFLSRAVSVWDRGGISFNPAILTPRSPHAVYFENIQNILKHFNHIAKKAPKERHVSKNHHNSYKKKANNIRDIIDALEHDVSENAPIQSPLEVELENKAYIDVKNSHGSMHSNNKSNTYQHNLHPNIITSIQNETTDSIKALDLQETLVMAESKQTSNSTVPAEHINNATLGILPMFLKFLFRNKDDMSTPKSIIANDKLTRKRKHVLLTENGSVSIKQEKIPEYPNKENKKFKSFVNSEKTNTNNTNINKTLTGKANNMNQLTIDLKGNIVSSEVSCHAFLGTMFSNAIHSKPQQSLTDFIISELSIFCKGALSTCNGIDVILL